MITFISQSKKDASLVAFGLKEIGPYYWVGNCNNGIDYYAGQTFQAPVAGLLKRIKLFSSVVYGIINATLSVYKFDYTNHTFMEKQSEITRQITKADENKWIDFNLSNTPLVKGEHYAFKLKCAGGGMLAIAECPWCTPNPYAEGEEWIGSSFANEGSFHKDFDLAFEGEIVASSNVQFI